MNRFKWLLVFIILVLIAGFSSSIIIVKNYYVNDVDTVEINKITNEVRNSWNNLNALDTASFTYDFIIVDPNENILYSSIEPSTKTLYSDIVSDKSIHNFNTSTNKNMINSIDSHSFTSIESIIKRHNTYINIIKDNKTLGTVIIFTNLEKDISSLKSQLSNVILFSFGILSLLLLLCFYYLYKTILHPFKRLESFAHQIASGNLEAPILMDKNNIFGAFTESFDIMREELNKAKKKEYLANKSKKELVASLSHDIKTPVTSIKLISELLLVMIKDEKINNKISSIYNKAEQIDHLVTDMFNITLEELNELKVTVTDEYSTSLKTLFNNADFYNKITLGKIPECAIQVDILRLQQVINNVINNSYKYADTKIDVDFTIDNLYLQINIKDYGQGVLDDELPLLFNKFYRGKNPNVQKQDGSGLGLHISKYLMNEMSGDINCYNESDGFKVELLIPIL